MLNCVLSSVLRWEVVDWIILCPPRGLSDGLIRKHTLLIEENRSALSPEIDMDASYFPLTVFFLTGIFIVITLFLLKII